jgi:hypothetical protein
MKSFIFARGGTMKGRLIRCGLALSTLIGSSAYATVMPEGRAIRPNKKVELKRKSGGFDTIARGFVKDAHGGRVAILGNGLDVSVGIQAENACYVYFRVTVPQVNFRFNGTNLSCYNYWNDDESHNNNNYQGLTIAGQVWDEIHQRHVYAQLTLWPKREDRIRMFIFSEAAGGFREWEIDVDEHS